MEKQNIASIFLSKFHKEYLIQLYLIQLYRSFFDFLMLQVLSAQKFIILTILF